jgi:hypothetical protein
MKLTTNRIWAIGYGIVVAGMVVLFYQDARQDAFDARRADDISAAKAETIDCVVKVLTETNNVTRETREAAQQRDDALVGSKRALRELIRLRVVEQTPDGPAVQQAADQYIHQTRKFIEASELLNQSRRDNPVPDPNKVCD